MKLGMQGLVAILGLATGSLLACSGDDAGAGPAGANVTSSTGGARSGAGGAGPGTGGDNGTGGTGTGTGGTGTGTGGTGTGTGGTGTGTGGGATSAGACTPGKPPTVGGCSVFSADDAWNQDVSCAPTDATWTSRIQAVVGAARLLHPDYGDGYGIPINIVPESATKVPVTFDDYGSESDPGPYPFPDPATARIEGGTPSACDGDCHFLVVQSGACMLYEGYHCSYTDSWHCSGGAKWDLSKNSYGQRPKGWTSADAAGLAIMPGLVRVDEVRSGAITHAIRFTLHCSRKNFVAPATHQAGGTSCGDNAPPMGLRVRLDPSKFDMTSLSASAQVVARAMQTYGMILADNGSDFYFQGEDDPRWTDEDIEPLKTIPASAFVVITPPPLEQ